MANYGVGVVVSLTDRFTSVANKVSRSMKGLGTVTTATIKSVASAAAGMAVGFIAMRSGINMVANTFNGEMIEASMNFRNEMSKVATLVDTSVEDMGKLSDQVLNTSAAFGQDNIVAAQATYQAISSSIVSASEANELLEASSRMAIGGVTDIKTAMDGLTNIMGAYGLRADSTTRISDSMFTAMRLGKTTINELASSLGRVAPLAANMGLSIEEMNAAVATITTSGIGTDEAVTGLKALLTQFIRAGRSKVSQKIGAQLGIDFSVEHLREVGFTGMIQELQKARESNQALFTSLFRSSNALNAIYAIGVEGGERYARQLKAQELAAGATTEAYEKMRRELKNQIDVFNSLSKALSVRLGDAPRKLKADLLYGFINPFLARFNEILDAFPALGTAILYLKIVLGGLLAVGGALLLLISGIMLWELIGGTVLLTNAIGVLGAFITATIIPALAALWPWLLGLGLIIGAVVIAWQTNLGGFRDFIQKWFGHLKDLFAAFKSVMNTENLGFADVPKEIADRLKSAGLYDIVIGFGRIWYRAKVMFDSFWKTFSKDFGATFSNLSETLGGFGETLGIILTRVMELFGFKMPTKGFGDPMTWRMMGVFAAKALMLIVDGVSTIIKIASFLIMLIIPAIVFIISLIIKSYQTIMWVGKVIGDFLVNTFTWVWGRLKDMFTWITDWFTILKPFVINIVNEIITVINNMIEVVAKTILDLLNKIPDQVLQATGQESLLKLKYKLGFEGAPKIPQIQQEPVNLAKYEPKYREGPTLDNLRYQEMIKKEYADTGKGQEVINQAIQAGNTTQKEVLSAVKDLKTRAINFDIQLNMDGKKLLSVLGQTISDEKVKAGQDVATQIK